MIVTLDDQLLSPVNGFLIRKGPGNCYFDFAQQIVFGAHQHASRHSQQTSVAGRQQVTPVQPL